MNNTQMSDLANEFRSQIIVDRKVEVSARQETAELKPAALAEFDLFAEARRIYERARAGRRGRSSSII